MFTEILEDAPAQQRKVVRPEGSTSPMGSFNRLAEKLDPEFAVCGASTQKREFLVNLSQRIEAKPHVMSDLPPNRMLSRYGGNISLDDIPKQALAGLRFLEECFCTPNPSCDSCPARFHCEYHAKRINRERADGPTFADFFCGAGGMSLGFERCGFAPKLALDDDPWSLFTYLWNRPGQREELVFALEDIRQWSKRENFLSSLIDVAVGGVPCQPFSNANRQRNSSDRRWNLFRDFVSSSVKLKPKIILIENVAGFSKVAPECVSFLDSCGYEAHPVSLNASYFGVPQSRARIFIFAYNKKYYPRCVSAHSRVKMSLEKSKSAEFIPLRDAIGDLPTLAASSVANNTSLENKTSGFAFALHNLRQSSAYVANLNQGRTLVGLFNHKARYNNERDISIFDKLQPGEDSRSPTIRSLMPYISRQHIFHDKYYRLRFDCVCRTITAHMRFDCNSYIHPKQARGLTVREAARIQGFPDDYAIAGTFQRLYQQIGNAVPPPLASCIGKAIKSVIE